MPGVRLDLVTHRMCFYGMPTREVKFCSLLAKTVFLPAVHRPPRYAVNIVLSTLGLMSNALDSPRWVVDQGARETKRLGLMTMPNQLSA